jgi:hypothetical protein
MIRLKWKTYESIGFGNTLHPAASAAALGTPRRSRPRKAAGLYSNRPRRSIRIGSASTEGSDPYDWQPSNRKSAKSLSDAHDAKTHAAGVTDLPHERH